MRSTIAVALILAASLQVGAADNPSWVYVLLSDRVLVAGSEDLNAIQTIPLNRSGAVGLHPTPGGKFVFVTYDGESSITAIDAETLQLSETTGLGFVPDGIGFSAMGDAAFLTSPSDNLVHSFDHRKAEFSNERVLSFGDVAAPTLVNRRATRLYRGAGDSLDFVYVKTGETIDSVRIRGGVAAISMSPDFRTLWAVGSTDGSLQVIDERRGRIAKSFGNRHLGYPAQFSDSLAFLLAEDGGSILAYGTRRMRLQQQIDIPETAEGFVVTDAGLIWSYGPAGIAVTDIETGGDIGSLPMSGITSISYVVVRSGEGYACF